MRSILFIATVLIWGTVAHGKGVEVKPAGARLTLTNTGSATLVSLKIGDAQVSRLAPQSSVDVKASSDSMVHGRFALSDWHLALEDLSPEWAPYHLRTAGFLLDATEPGSPGTPEAAANLKALQTVGVESLAAWPDAEPLRQALVARAARFAPPSLTATLMGQITPSAPASTTWPPGYEGLESAVDSVRAAIERHGAHPAILAALRARPDWARDRGFGYPALLDFAKVAKVGAEPPSAVNVTELTGRLAAALEAGRHAAAAQYAVESARLVTTADLKDPALTRMACGGLDLGAHHAIKEARWLSAQAYLTLAGRVCGDRLTYRARVAEVFRRRGDLAIQALDLTQALDWFRGALWFGSERQDRARLADTHAELAILNFRTGNPVRGAEHLSKANEFGPLRPRVVAASEHKPTVDPRARFGLIIIILFVGFFAIRRLLRLFGDRHSRPRLD